MEMKCGFWYRIIRRLFVGTWQSDFPDKKQTTKYPHCPQLDEYFAGLVYCCFK